MCKLNICNHCHRCLYKCLSYQSFPPKPREFESRSWPGVLDTTLCDKVQVSDLQQVCGFLRLLRFSPPIKLTTMI